MKKPIKRSRNGTLTKADAARVLGISSTLLYFWNQRGDGPHTDKDGHYTTASLRKWLESEDRKRASDTRLALDRLAEIKKKLAATTKRSKA